MPPGDRPSRPVTTALPLNPLIVRQQQLEREQRASDQRNMLLAGYFDFPSEPDRQTLLAAFHQFRNSYTALTTPHAELSEFAVLHLPVPNLARGWLMTRMDQQGIMQPYAKVIGFTSVRREQHARLAMASGQGRSWVEGVIRSHEAVWFEPTDLLMRAVARLTTRGGVFLPPTLALPSVTPIEPQAVAVIDPGHASSGLIGRMVRYGGREAVITAYDPRTQVATVATARGEQHTAQVSVEVLRNAVERAGRTAPPSIAQDQYRPRLTREEIERWLGTPGETLDVESLRAPAQEIERRRDPKPDTPPPSSPPPPPLPLRGRRIYLDDE